MVNLFSMRLSVVQSVVEEYQEVLNIQHEGTENVCDLAQTPQGKAKIVSNANVTKSLTTNTDTNTFSPGLEDQIQPVL